MVAALWRRLVSSGRGGYYAARLRAVNVTIAILTVVERHPCGSSRGKCEARTHAYQAAHIASVRRAASFDTRAAEVIYRTVEPVGARVGVARGGNKGLLRCCERTGSFGGYISGQSYATKRVSSIYGRQGARQEIEK